MRASAYSNCLTIFTRRVERDLKVWGNQIAAKDIADLTAIYTQISANDNSKNEDQFDDDDFDD